MRKNAAKTSFRSLPKTYAGLVALLPPRPIHDDVHIKRLAERFKVDPGLFL
jgi:hypothetical protein